MKKMHLLWAALCSLAFVSCTNEKQSAGLIEINISQQIDNPDEVPLRDLAESVEFVQLETSDSLLMKGLYKLNMFDDYFLIDGNLFDRSGKFIRRIFRGGPGPEEVAMAMQVSVKDNQIHVLDRTGIIKLFSLEGQFLGQLKAPGNTYFDIRPLGKERYVGFKSNFTGKEKTCLEFFTNEGLQGTVPYTFSAEPLETMFCPGEGKFFAANEELLLKRLANDTIYRINPEQYTMEPVYHINYGRWASDEMVRYSFKTMEDLQQNLFVKMPFVDFLGESNNHIVFTQIITDMTKMQMTTSTTLYNCTTQEAKCVILKFSKDDFQHWGTNPDEDLGPRVGVSYQDFLPTFISEDGQYLIAWRQRDGLQEDLNPTLAIVKLK